MYLLRGTFPLQGPKAEQKYDCITEKRITLTDLVC
jgi:hypothetical protein